MQAKFWLRPIAIAFGVWAFSLLGSAKADEWGRYYHWPYHDIQQYQWSPYEYERTYGGFRYPPEMRVYNTMPGYRNWATVRKPYYRGYHFVLDRF
jgi:hypothetical protein